ncbi:MAG: T9SS type A sorting domain-containing protein [Chitinophagales bacterium]
MQIFNAVGQLIYENQLLSNHTEIDSSNFRSGLYIVVLETEKGKTNYRLVKGR